MKWPRQPLLMVGFAAWIGAAAAWAVIAAPAPDWLPAQLVGLVLLAGAIPWLVPDLQAGRIATALVCLGLLAGAASAATHLATTRSGDVRLWAAQRAQVEVEGRVLAAAPARRETGAGQVRAIVAVRALGPKNRQQTIRTSAVLVASQEVLGVPARGTQLRVRGTLLPLQDWREPAITVAAREVLQRAPPTGFAAFVTAARARMWQAMAGIDPDAASLVAGLAIGDDARQSTELGEAMRVSGLAHLTAVSGGNIMVVAAAVIGAAALLGASLRVRIIAAVLAVLAYSAFVGPQPSVLRAAVMGCAGLVGLLRSTRRGGPAVLGGAVLVLIGTAPGLALSWGFALSVSATAGILLLAPRLDLLLGRHLPQLAAAAATACSVTVAAQLATAPLLAAMTGDFSIIGLVANVAAAPLVVPITLLGLLLVLTAGPVPGVAAVVAETVEPFGGLLAAIARTAAAFPHATIDVSGAAGTAATIVCAAALGGLILAVTRPRRGAESRSGPHDPP